MTDDELEIWRRQWHSQPAVPIDLIRRVERQTVYMRLARWSLLAPTAVSVGTSVIAALDGRIDAIVFAVGMWLFVAIGWWFSELNTRGIWAPAAETTAAYLELSIERCRRQLKDYRFGRVMALLITAFVLIGLYQGLKSRGALETASQYWVTGATYVFTVAVVSFAMFLQNQKRKKTEAELTYLLNLQRQLADS